MFTGCLFNTVYTAQDSEGTTASGEGLSRIEPGWEWDLVHSVATEAERSLRGKRPWQLGKGDPEQLCT